MTQAATGATFLGHPRGLVILFLTEMWERFSYYGMRSMLIFYLTQHFLFSDTPAYGIYSAYISMIYISPILGGFVADRWLGFRRAVLVGGILIACGHGGMAIEGAQATIDAAGQVTRDGTALQILYFSLALIVAGTGLLKPNISAIVGTLYPQEDRRRDGGFTIFYMGINIGAFIATLTCAKVAQLYGWSWGFGLAGIGMVLGVAIFIIGRKWLEGHGEAPDPAALRRVVFAGLSANTVVIAGCVLVVFPIWLLMQNSAVVGGALGLAGGLAILAVIVYASLKLEPVARHRVFAILLLMPFHALFWAFFEQTGTSMALFAERGIELKFFGLDMAAGQIQSINPICIIAFAPVIALIWGALDRKGWEPGIPVKFALGLFQIGLGFLVFVLGIHLAAPGEKVWLGWLALGILLHSTGELCISPVGLSAVTKLSLARLSGLMMGVWFLSNAFANYGAGLIAMTASVDHMPGEEVDVVQALPVYGSMFNSVGWTAIGCAALLLLISPLLKKLMHGVR